MESKKRRRPGLTSVLIGSSLTATHVLAGFGLGIISRSVFQEELIRKPFGIAIQVEGCGNVQTVFIAA
jgi:hypothetical protein